VMAVRPQRGQVMPDPWTLGLLAKGMGLNLLSQRGLISDVWSISLANSLLLMGPLFCYAALQRIRGVATNFFLIAAVPVSVGILLAIVGFGPEQFRARGIIFTGAAVFGFSLNCWSAARLWQAGYKAGTTLILASSIVLGTLAVAHILAVAGGNIVGLFGGSALQLTLYTVNGICIALSTFGYMDILRTLRDRQAPIDPDLLPDALTGLYSRPAFVRIAQAELIRAKLRGHPVSVMKIQIDGFDPLNAAHGRTFADQQLKRVADAVQGDIRNFDFAARLSANTIGVMMPELTREEGEAAAERIRAAIEASEVSHNGAQLKITISVGLCAAEPEHADLDSVLALAAACLHRAHLMGGNQIATPASAAPKGFIEGTI
jgi:diguanylate cyclase (GGDEF)-like protein